MPPKISVSIVNLQKKIPVKNPRIVQAVKKVLRHENVKNVELSIVLVTDSRMKSLNKQYLNEHHSTDVLSFDFSRHSEPAAVRRGKNLPGPPVTKAGAGRMTEAGAPQIFGEIVISTDTAIKNAKVYHTTPQREILLYVVHGILHLLGYDDHRNCDIRKMRRQEQILMNFLSQ